MKKDEFVKRYGIVAYEKQMKRVRDWRLRNTEKTKDYQRGHSAKGSNQMEKGVFAKEWGSEIYEEIVNQARDWALSHPEKVKKYQQEYGKKGINYYFKKLICDHVGLARTRNHIMHKHGSIWRKYKRFVAPRTRLHYEWIPDIDEYKCVAIVETVQSQYPFKDVIHIPGKHRGKIYKFLIKHLIPKCLIHNQPIPAFTEEELQAGI